MTEIPPLPPPPEGGAAQSGRLPLQPSSGLLTSSPSTTNPNLLGFPPLNSATSSAAGNSPTSAATSSAATAHRDVPPPAGGTHVAANSLLGFQPTRSTIGQFPKLSSNFDKVDSRQQQTLPSPSAVPAPVSRTPQATDGASAAQRGFQPPLPDSQKSDHEPSNDKSQAAQTFADIAARKTAKPPDLFTHGLSAITPVKDPDGVTVIMPQALYEQRLLLYKFALIGRIFLPPGASPRSNEDYKAELSKSFQTSGDWKLLHLGKGYFSLLFRLQEDQLRAARHKSWRLSTGSIHIREWQPNFDPYKESSSTAQIWVRLYHLPTEYWHPEFLVGIFRSVGNVIKLDGNTAHGLVGHFARALVEVDLSTPLLDSVRVGLPDNLFVVDFSYENTPMLCSFCHYIGHSADQCRKAKVAPAGGGELDKGTHLHDNAPARKKKKWVEVEGEQKQSTRIVHIGTVVEKIHAEQEKLETSNSYDALQNLDSEETVPETQLSAGDIMDLVTGGPDASLQHSLKEKLITAARECAMNRQLRDERDATSSAAPKDTPAAAAADSDSGEELEAQPSSTPSATVAPTAPAAAPNMDVDQTAAAGIDPPAQGETTLLPSSHGVVAAIWAPAPAAPNMGSFSDHKEATGIDTPTHMEATSIDTPTQGAAALQPSMMHNVVAPADLNVAVSDPLTGGEGTQPSDNMVAPPPAQAQSTTRRTKNKRKVTEVPKRQGLRSSTKNKSISDITPEMIQAYAHNQCSVQVPAESLGQSKAIKVAPNSPHPKRAQLEDLLRSAAALGQHPTAYVLDTGQRGALQAMDLVANQQWDAFPHTEACTDSDFNSD